MQPVATCGSGGTDGIERVTCWRARMPMTVARTKKTIEPRK
jgi:hypothetical protein